MSQAWRLMVFTPPPPWAFMRVAKSGKCWFRLFKTREQVLAVSRRLKSEGIKYRCDKVDSNQRSQDMAAAFRAGIVEGLKQARVAATANKRREELERQDIRRIATDQLHRAQEVAKRMN